jgi:hypothetical protein
MLDAFRFASRLTGELGRIGLSRFLPASKNVPRSLDGVSREWIEGALADRFPGARLEAVETLDEDSGTTARRRVSLRYAGDKPEGAPDSAFVKVMPPRLTEQVFGRIFALGPNEVAFYRHVRPQLPVHAPDVYSVRVGRGGTYALLLEDLTTGGTKFQTIADLVSLTEAEAVVDALAKLHAAFWGPNRFAWLRTAAANPNESLERYVCQLAHRPTLKLHSDLLPARVRAGAGRIHAERRSLERYWADAPLTLIHGDSHAGNVYFVDGEAGLFDWQVAQHHQGIRDVAYFIILSLDTEVRRAHERTLFNRYVRGLREAGVPKNETSADWLWERYRSFSLYAYIGASVTTTMSDLQPEHVARTGLRRAAVAVDDLDALAILGRIARR